MISKELLSEVLDLKYPIRIIHHFCKGQNLLNYDLHVECALFQESINIYELAHKCKEWALKKDKYKWLFSYKAFIDCWCDIVDNHNRKNIIMSFRADTEPEAIFKACQWILENR